MTRNEKKLRLLADSVAGKLDIALGDSASGAEYRFDFKLHSHKVTIVIGLAEERFSEIVAATVVVQNPSFANDGRTISRTRAWSLQQSAEALGWIFGFAEGASA